MSNHNYTFQEVANKFDTIFKYDIRAIKVEDRMFSMINKRYTIDIIELDDRLHELGYDELKDGSMSDYILSHYGQAAVDFIQELT